MWTPIRYTSTLEMGMVQICSIAEIVPKSLFLYNCVQTEPFSSMAFVPAQKLSIIQCIVSIALVTALKWDILENKATVKTFRSPIHWPFSILESAIVHSVCSSSPPHFAWRMHSIWFQWENLRFSSCLGARGCPLLLENSETATTTTSIYFTYIFVR